MKVGSKVGSVFLDLVDLVLILWTGTMENNSSMPRGTGSNPVRGTRLSLGQTPFYYGVCCFYGRIYWKIIHRGDHIKIDKIFDKSW